MYDDMLFDQTARSAESEKLSSALTPCSLTPVAPHLAADTGFFWYWYVNRPPADSSRLEQEHFRKLLSSTSISCPHTWCLDHPNPIGLGGIAMPPTIRQSLHHGAL